MIRAAGRPATERLTFQNEILIFAEEDHKGTDFPNEIDAEQRTGNFRRIYFQFAELPVFEFRGRKQFELAVSQHPLLLHNGGRVEN